MAGSGSWVRVCNGCVEEQLPTCRALILLIHQTLVTSSRNIVLFLVSLPKMLFFPLFQT